MKRKHTEEDQKKKPKVRGRIKPSSQGAEDTDDTTVSKGTSSQESVKWIIRSVPSYIN